MTKAELAKIAYGNCILDCEVSNAIQFVQDLLEFRAKETERDEPYAANSIKHMKEAAHEVFDLQSYVGDVMEEE